MEIITKKGPVFRPQNVRKSRRAKMGLPSMHTLYPSLGVRKRAQTITVRSLVSANEKAKPNTKKPTSKTKTKQNKQNQQKQTKQPTKASKESADKTAPKDNSSWCAGELKDLAHERQHTRPQSKILRRCPAKHIIQQHRNPGSPLPGSRRSH